MRIGTWNLAGRWSAEHLDFLMALDCDVLLLTEVSEHTDVPDRCFHLSEQLMAPRRRWAGILSRGSITPLPDPHPASAMGLVDSWTFCCSVLPWVGAGDDYPYGGDSHPEKVATAITWLARSLPTTGIIWGGDWNQDLEGRVWTGSNDGRDSVTAAVSTLGLVVPTAPLPSARTSSLSVNHIAVPKVLSISDARWVAASRRLSDHDAYVVDCNLGAV